MAEGLVQPPDPEARYHGKPIPNDYALVDMAWTADQCDGDELDIPTEEGGTTLGHAIGSRVLWNKADFAFEERKPASKPSQPSSSAPGGPSDDDDDGNSGDDNGGDGNDNAGGQGSSPQ